ncbi:MAG: efflux RND transporter periplasmic adaptor subunit [Chitinophagaceae bacterium]
MLRFSMMLFGTVVFMWSSCKQAPKADTTVVPKDTIPVKLLPLQSVDAPNSIYVSGRFTTENETFLSFKIGGIIQQLLVNEGDAVVQGQTLATLNMTEINAQVQQAVIGVEKAERDYKRATNLFKDSVATLEQVQNAKTGLDIAQQQLTAAKFNQQYAVIKAPASGFILKKLSTQGQITGPGTPVLLMNVTGNNWVLKTAVSDVQWSAIRIGDKAVISADAWNKKTIVGTVKSKSEGVDAATGTLTVNIMLPNPTLNIAAGLFGKATITTSQPQKGWQLPYDAILDGDAGSGFVFASNDQKKVQRVPVQIQQIKNGNVLVTSGLEGFSYVVTAGNAYLKEGVTIKPIQ